MSVISKLDGIYKTEDTKLASLLLSVIQQKVRTLFFLQKDGSLTMQVLKEGTTRSILEDHHSCERLVACAVAK